MSGEFTSPAKKKWDAIPAWAQQHLLSTVWCVHCSRMTTITNFKGQVKKGDLVLSGYCVACGGGVARLIKSE
ncbi:MAG: hypothetical protein K8S97_16470 [Anaerolineae bacterium]|nr:hypothetical protein [Anaerolineae bacterium]